MNACVRTMMMGDLVRRVLRHLRLLLSTSSAGFAASSSSSSGSGISAHVNGQSSVAKETAAGVLLLQPPPSAIIPSLVSERRLEYIAVISGSMFTILLVTCAGVALFLVRRRHHSCQRKYTSAVNCGGAGAGGVGDSRGSESDTLAVAMNRLYPGSDDCGGAEEGIGGGGVGGGGEGLVGVVCGPLSGGDTCNGGGGRTKASAKTINGHVYSVVATSDVESDVGRVQEEMRRTSSSLDAEEDDQERRRLACDDGRGACGAYDETMAKDDFLIQIKNSGKLSRRSLEFQSFIPDSNCYQSAFSTSVCSTLPPGVKHPRGFSASTRRQCSGGSLGASPAQEVASFRHCSPQGVVSLTWSSPVGVSSRSRRKRSGSYAPSRTPDLLERRSDLWSPGSQGIRLTGFAEKLLDGDFYEVLLYDALLASPPPVSSSFGVSSDESLLVAIKRLKPDISEEQRAIFYRETLALSRLRDANVVRLLGVTHDGGGDGGGMGGGGSCGGSVASLCAIYEFSIQGYLKTFLQERVFEEPFLKPDIDGVKRPLSLCFATLLQVVLQIASGMRYLESVNHVHRDLGTRNCLIDQHNTVKICCYDNRGSSGRFSGDYSCINGHLLLPIRWMSWESVLLGRFSSRSDVWSFGITMWEVFTLAKYQPLSSLTDREVFENLTHFHIGDGLPVLPQRPSSCPRDIYNQLVKRCWSQREERRPPFDQIVAYLRQKCAAYRS